MSDAYDVTSFNLEYRQKVVSAIIEKIKKKSSCLVIGMPGCGKSRLIDFILNRPGMLEQYGLSRNWKAIRLDCDIGVTDPRALYLEILQALNYEVKTLTGSSLDTLNNLLMFEVEKLESNIDLVVIFDNFSRQLQLALGENFFKFLSSLRERKPGLNIIYIFVANLSIDFSGFYKLNRLFDKGPDLSICWVSLLNKKDTFFSIDRQLRKEGENPNALSKEDKTKIFELGGGHALLTKYLSHLMLSDRETLASSEMVRLLDYGGIRGACEAIWRDLEQHYKNLLIDIAEGLPISEESKAVKLRLEKYGVLHEQSFFSPLFASFVARQQKASEVKAASCDENKTRIVIKTVDGHEKLLALNGLSQRKRTLLCYLLTNQSEMFTKDQLIKVGWPADDPEGVTDEALRRQMDGIKSWLKEQQPLSQYLSLELMWGVGYRLDIIG